MIICNLCGREVADGTPFCPHCGAPLSAPTANGTIPNQPQPGQPNPQPIPQPAPMPNYPRPGQPMPNPINQDYYNPEPLYQPAPIPVNTPSETSILILGVLSLVFGGIIGIILGAIGKKKANQYQLYAPLTGSAKVGAILSKVGVILGIVSTVFYCLYSFFFIIGAVNGAVNGTTDYYYSIVNLLSLFF